LPWQERNPAPPLYQLTYRQKMSTAQLVITVHAKQINQLKTTWNFCMNTSK